MSTHAPAQMLAAQQCLDEAGLRVGGQSMERVESCLRWSGIQCPGRGEL